MDISVCICTRNRPDSLRRTLSSLGDSRAPGVDWEALVIDNASKSPIDLDGALRCGASVRVEVEPCAGLSHARNKALDEAAGDYVIFIDDDVTVPVVWLAAYAAAFQRYPQAAFFGGPIIAQIDSSGLRQRSAQRMFAALAQVMPGALSWLDSDCPEGPLPADGPLLPWGANMAFRRAAFQGRRFDVRRGRRPREPHGSGEETQLLREMRAAGLQGVWLPSARLNHHIGAERFSRRYLRSFSRGVGYAEGRRAAFEQHQNPAGVRDWAASTASAKRRARWTTPPWAPLESRLRTISDLAGIEGFIKGLEETLDEIQQTKS